MHAWLLDQALALARATGAEIKPEAIKDFNESLNEPIPGITRNSERRDADEGESWGALLGAMGGSVDE